VLAARQSAWGSVLCCDSGGAPGAFGAGREVPFRLEAAKEVMLYPMEEDNSEMDSWIWTG